MRLVLDMAPRDVCFGCPCFYDGIECKALGILFSDINVDPYDNRPSECIERFGK